MYKILPNDDDTYKIQTYHGKYLYPLQDGTFKQTSSSDVALKWMFENAGNGMWCIKSAYYDKYIRAEENNMEVKLNGEQCDLQS